MRKRTFMKWLLLTAGLTAVFAVLSPFHPVQGAGPAPNGTAASVQKHPATSAAFKNNDSVQRQMHFKFNRAKPVNISAYLTNQEVWVPAETVLKALHIPYQMYNSGILELYADSHHLIFKAGQNTLYDNGNQSVLNVPPVYINGTLYLPATTLVSHLNYRAYLDNRSNTILFQKEGG